MKHHNKLLALNKETAEQQQELGSLLQAYLTMQATVIEPVLEMRSLLETSSEEFIPRAQLSEKFYQAEIYTAKQQIGRAHV